jgi:ankyrin repeat protein
MFFEKFDEEISQCCEKGDIEYIQKLFEKSPDLINFRNKQKKTPLHVATLFQQYEIIEFLLKNNANPNALDGYSSTALHSACNKGLADISILLLGYKADVNCR